MALRGDGDIAVLNAFSRSTGERLLHTSSGPELLAKSNLISGA
jgi:hypothetical protein